MTQPEEQVVAVRRGRIGHIVLNRPKALHALNLEMIRSLDRVLRAWKFDDSVEAVVVSGEGDRAFCAGGDVKAVYYAGKAAKDSESTLTEDFFREEYSLNYAIANYGKPYVALIDGITMGGGAGISIHGSHRVATERTKFAMPETGIGLFPDVGGSRFMSSCGPVGVLVALTGQVLGPAATVELGLATHFVSHQDIQALLQQLASDGVDQSISQFSREPPETDSLSLLRQIADRCVAPAQCVEDVIKCLEQLSRGDDSILAEAAKETSDRLLQRSPTSLKVAWEQLRRGVSMSLADCFIMEYRLSQACMRGHDLYEGIRAVLVDKDQTPKWSPDSLEKVSTDLVDRHFQPLGDGDLQLPKNPAVPDKRSSP